MAQTINFSDSTPIAPANAVNVKWQSDNSNPPNISAYVLSGVGGCPNVVAKSLLTAQSAAIAATTLFAIPSNGAGLYRVSYVATITTAASGGANGPSSLLGGVLGFQLKFTNGNGDTAVKTANQGVITNSSANTTGTTVSGDAFGYCGASTNLQYLFDYSSVGTTAMLFDLAVFVEYVGA